MRVARCYSFTDVRVEEIPEPRIGPGEALVRVRVCGVCTGEAMPWYVNQKCPAVLGHEPVGTIVRLIRGRGSPPFRIGDRVFFHHHTSCGRCVDCRRGHPTLCGEFHQTRLDPGGFAEYVRIPRLNLQKDTLKIPPAVPDEDAVLIEPLACSIHAVKRLHLKKGDTVLIIGTGIMGLLNIQSAKLAGAGKILACDLKADRLRAALRVGATAAFKPDLGRLRRETAGRGADCVMVGPPNVEALAWGFQAAAPGATIQLFAPMPPDARIRPNFHDLYFKEQSVTTSYSCDSSDTRDALKLLAAGKIRTKGLITHRYGLDGVGRALWETYKGKHILKAAIYPGLVGHSRRRSSSV